MPLFGRAVAFNSLTVAISLSPCFLKVKGRIAARWTLTASLQGCGGHERGGVLAPKGQNDKEMKRFFSPAGPIPKVKSSLISVRFCVLAARFTRVLSLFPSLDSRGSRERRTFGSPAASCAKVKSTRVSHHRSAETIRHSLRDDFTTYSALSPAIGLFCHRHQRNAKALPPASRQRRGVKTTRLCRPRDKRIRLVRSPAAIASRAQRP